ncbi:nitrilase-related carbon-nitrogen hydrolase [Hansschlegelia sp. KR7-227]|uniref:nitrilase-related carbon-nitrogen hydrolase n=1 Tax=Hansschlegelia sp. KR7-227 TaxID=3400914 RepID=UPI003C0C02F9
MIVAAYQMVAACGGVAANLAAIERAAEAAAGQGARILVAPELAITGYGAGDAIRALAEPVDGPQLTALSSVARRLGIALAFGFAEREGTTIYNSAAFLSPDGWMRTHRKVFLYGAYEKALFTAAKTLSGPFAFEGATVGMRVCFDVEFPESVRALALAGADLVLAPTALPAGPGSDFIARTMAPTRAFENGVTLVYADHAGRDGAFSYAGQSVIAFADGREGARAGAEGEALLVAAIDPAAALRARTENDYLGELAAVSGAALAPMPG